ncbi:MAG: IMP dehydrogenase, partial [Verrucomicrobiota bacterium]
MGDIELGYSFDDVLLVPQKSGITPGDADLRSKLTARIPLNIPVVSSAMDTVSEDALAIALAREGGIGVVHRNCTIEKQAEMVAKVKRSENMIIPDPFTVTREISIETLQNIMDERGVAGFPVIDGEGKLE